MFAAPCETPVPNEAIIAARLAARLAALQNALDNLPAQARRLARACLKRKSMPAGPRAVPPLRPGLAPGYKKRGRGEIDEILRECDALARDALAAPPYVFRFEPAALRVLSLQAENRACLPFALPSAATLA